MSETRYRVTPRGVIHREDCAHVTNPCTRSISLTYGGLLKSDKPCTKCLPDGLPADRPTPTTAEEAGK